MTENTVVQVFILASRVSHPKGLTQLSPGLSHSDQVTGMLMQGSLEASNVNVVEEMVNMIETQRAYEVNSKAIAAADGMLRFLNNNL